MGAIVVEAFISLDGVVQGGGAPDEDREGGFELGGWAMDFDAEHPEDSGEDLVREWESRTEALLLGRKTYDIWARSWGVWDENAPGLEGELTRRYNRIPKYVASRTRTELGWKNSFLLGPDVPEEVERVRQEIDGEIRIWGSTELVRTLAGRGLIDEYRLCVYPLLLGTGKKLFPDGFPSARLGLAESRRLPSGVLVNTYRRA
ncbi:dihydrofolate reductase family protein [Leifsonia sp. LS-T14]|uniref:dihydrofolate reductase family protein n=1 Tax=unclassified Leifsonia TaxID=2663824 RepID=UPI0035A6D09D